jgi:hypothetical protein
MNEKSRRESGFLKICAVVSWVRLIGLIFLAAFRINDMEGRAVPEFSIH